MIENPYRYLGPLNPEKDKLVCVERRQQLSRVIKGIKRGEYFLIHSPRLFGKTTFLRQIKRNIHDIDCIYFDLQGFPDSEAEFYQTLMERICDEIPTNIKGSRKSMSSSLDFHDFLKRFKPKDDRQILFLFDEMASIPFLLDFFLMWRRVASESSRYVAVFAGIGDGVRDAAINFAYSINLENFSKEEVEQFIRASLMKLQFKISRNAKFTLTSRLSGHPQMLQHLFHILIEHTINKDKKISEQDVYDALDSLLANNASIDTLRMDLERNPGNKEKIIRILKGERLKYFPAFGAYYHTDSGAIVSDNEGFCAIRNSLYEKFLREYLGFSGPIEKSTKDLFFDGTKKKALPFAVKQFHIENFYDLKKVVTSDIPVDTQWIFLTGDNGFGKTILLQALAIGLFGNKDFGRILADDQEDYKIGVELVRKGTNSINNFDSRVTAQRGFEQFTHLAAYGPSRLQVQSPQSQNKIEKQSSPPYSLFNVDGILLNIEIELLKWHRKGDKQKFNLLRSTLLKALHNIADIRVMEVRENGTTDEKVFYYEAEAMEGENYQPVTFEKLAAGHKSIVAMVGDILARLFARQEDVEKTEDLGGIVIIDELDLHLHPKRQQEIPSLLSHVFPCVQFIASTHSVIPFLGAPEKSVFLKVNRDRNGIGVERLDQTVDIKNLLPNSILTSPIFDMDKITHISKKGKDDLADVRTEDNFQKILQHDKFKKILKAIEESDGDFPYHLFDSDGETDT